MGNRRWTMDEAAATSAAVATTTPSSSTCSADLVTEEPKIHMLREANLSIT